MKVYLSMSDERRRAACAQASGLLGLPETSVEKDFWVSWTLQKLFGLPTWGEALTFKGGTSLSKCWKLIERFSEDIDIVIDRKKLGFADEHAPEAAPSNKAKKKRLDALGEAAQACVQGDIQSLLRQAMAEELAETSPWVLEPDRDDPQHQTLLFKYPCAFEEPSAYLRPVVKIEMGARSETDPVETVDIRPLLSEALPDVFSDSAFAVRSVSPVRTFWEKAMLLHVEGFRPPDKKRKRGMARHYYDVYRLIQQKVAAQAAQDEALFARIVAHRKDYFNYAWMDYSTIARGTLNIIPAQGQLADWQSDYAAMREMFYGEVPDFAQVLETVEKFQNDFNGQA